MESKQQIEWKGIVYSNGQGERQSAFIPITVFIFCFIISSFSFYEKSFHNKTISASYTRRR